VDKGWSQGTELGPKCPLQIYGGPLGDEGALLGILGDTPPPTVLTNPQLLFPPYLESSAPALKVNGVLISTKTF